MKSFQFPLEKILEWRRRQVELEQSNLRRHLGALAELDRKAAEVEASAAKAEQVVRAWNPVSAGELQALDRFRIHVRAKEIEMAVPRAEARKRVEAQRALLLETQRRVRLLENLKQRRLAEWEAERDKELEQTAAESYLARWNR